MLVSSSVLSLHVCSELVLTGFQVARREASEASYQLRFKCSAQPRLSVARTTKQRFHLHHHVETKGDFQNVQPRWRPSDASACSVHCYLFRHRRSIDHTRATYLGGPPVSNSTLPCFLAGALPEDLQGQGKT